MLLGTNVVVIGIVVIVILVVVFGHLGRRRRDRKPGREVCLVEDLLRRHDRGPGTIFVVVVPKRRPGRRGGPGGGCTCDGCPGGPCDRGGPGGGHGGAAAAAATTAAATAVTATAEAAPVDPKAVRILTSDSAGPAISTRRRSGRGSRGDARPRSHELRARHPAGVVVQRGPKRVAQTEDRRDVGRGRGAHRRARRPQQR